MKKFLTLLLFLIFSVQNSFAVQEIKKIDLKTAIDIAQKNNLDIKSSRLDINRAKNDIKISNRLQNPDFNIFYNFGKAGAGNPQQLGLSETIELGKRGARKKLAKANFELTKDNINYLEFDLRMDVREAYVNLIAAKSILKALEGQEKLLEDLAAIAQKKVNAGASPEMDLIQAKIALNQMITQVNSARVDVKAALIEFNKIINTKNEVFDSIDEKFPDNSSFMVMMTPRPKAVLPDFDLISSDVLNKRFDIKIAKSEVEVAKKNLTVVARQRIPDLAILGGYGYQSKGMSEDGTFLSGAYAGASLVNIPLFYNYSPEIKNAKIDVDKALLKYESTENKALKDLQRAYEKFVTAKLNLNYYNDKLVKESEELIKLSKRSYEAGKSNLTALIVMEQSYKSIIVGYNYALAEYYNSWADFLREVNTEEFYLNEEDI